MLSTEELYKIFLEHPLISTDTRQIKEGSMFFALKGENFDANQFAMQALEKGAAFAVVDDNSLEDHPKLLKVENVLESLQALGKHHRIELGLPVIGITGSNGKTTTKELMHAVLSKKFNVLATAGNYNNHIGVPLTLLRLTKDHNMAIIEMGANHQGEIDFLTRLSDPDYGVITNIGKAHLEGFGGIEGVRKGKTELYRYMAAKGGKLFVNAQDPVLMQDSEGIERVLYGDNEVFRSSSKENEAGRITVSIQYEGKDYEASTLLFGAYNYTNILCAVGIGIHFGVAVTEICEALSEYEPTNNRSQILKTKNNNLILDAYNANPSSMAEALNSFGKLNESNKFVILGDMLELGDDAAMEHAKVAELVKEKGLDAVLVGPIFSALKSEYPSFDNAEEAKEYLSQSHLRNYNILIKGSRGIRLENVVDVL